MSISTTTSNSTKLSGLESFSKHGKIGSKSDQQATFRGLLDLYNGDFLSLFQDTVKHKTSESLIDMIQIINHIDELSIHFLSFGNILEVLSFLVNLKKEKVITDMLELLRNGIKDFSSTPLNDYVFTVALSSIPSQDIALSEVSCVLVEHFLVANTTYLTQFHTHSVPYLDRDTTIFLRYTAVVSKVLSKSDTLFKKCLETNNIDTLWSACQSTDILTQIVAIEFLKDFAHTREGLHHLFTSGKFNWLISVACESFETRGGRHDPVLVAQGLREIAEIFHRAASNHLLDGSFWSAVVEKDILHKFIKAVLSHLDGITEETRLTGLRAISDFASSSPQALGLISDDVELLQTWGGLLNTGKMEVQAAVLHSIAHVLESSFLTTHSSISGNLTATSSTSESLTSTSATTTTRNESYKEVEAMKAKLWNCIGEAKRMPTLAFLLRLVQQPVPNLRHAGLDVLCSVLRSDEVSTGSVLATSSSSSELCTDTKVNAALVSSWGLQLLGLSSEFREYITNQETEFSKEGREWKFALVQALCRHQQLDLLAGIGGGWVDLLKKIEARGPFYRPPQQAEMLTIEH